MILLKHNNNTVEPFEISESGLKQYIGELNCLFNDPMDSCQKAIDDLKYLWEGLANLNDLRLDLEAWINFDKVYRQTTLYPLISLNPCNQRTVKTVERTCCGGNKTNIVVYYCNEKNQPTTELGCSKCTIRNEHDKA